MGEGVVLNLDTHHTKIADEIRERAKIILNKEMPAKVLELNDLVKKYAFDLNTICDADTVMILHFHFF